MALPGPVDHARGALHPSPILSGWANVDAAAELESGSASPCTSTTTPTSARSPRSRSEPGATFARAAYMQMSSGIGAGLIVDGRPYHGHRGIAGEIGHVLVDEQGQICRCGNRGCLETLASGPALVALLRPSHGDGLTVERIIAMARDGDPGARRAIADAGRAVGQVVAGLCNLFNPEMVVVGGDLSTAGELLLDPLRESIDRYALPAATEQLEVVAGELGERANLLGALALAIAQSGRGSGGAHRGNGERGVSFSKTIKPRRRGVHVRRKRIWSAAAAVTLAMASIAAGCGDDDDDGDSGGGGDSGGDVGKVAVLLPDSKSSVRWETYDRPLLQKAFDDAGVDADISNAEGDKSTQQQQAEQAITNGAKVLLLVNLDSGSGAAIAANAKSQGVKVIDYDRLTLDTDANDYYVSFDNEKVGKLQGAGPRGLRGQQAGRPDRGSERIAHGQQRNAVQERVRLRHQPEVRLG